MNPIFKQRLDQEILVGEKLRLTALATVFSLGSLIATLLIVFSPEAFETIKGDIKPQFLFILFMGFSIYALALRAFVVQMINRKAAIPRWVVYLNAAIETSMPSLIILYLSKHVHPSPYVLVLPPPFLYALFIVLSTLRLDSKLCIFCGFVAGAEYLIISFHLMSGPEAISLHPFITASLPNISKAVLLQCIGVICGLSTHRIQTQFLKTFNSMEERNRVIDLFGQHVSPAVVDKLLRQNIHLGAQTETRHVCIMFLDIRNFTVFSEQRTPEEVVAYLNSLFEGLVDRINSNLGIVNKFLGDGFMAMFGAPLSDGQDCQNAIRASLEILKKVEELNAQGKIPPTQIGIGIHTGSVVTGNIGSSSRKEYTVIGDVVNVASRIEQLNKQYGSKILISGAVLEKIRDLELEGRAQALGSINVKGRSAAIDVYQLA